MSTDPAKPDRPACSRAEVEQKLLASYPAFAAGLVIAVVGAVLRRHRLAAEQPGAVDWPAVLAAAEEHLQLRLAVRGEHEGQQPGSLLITPLTKGS